MIENECRLWVGSYWTFKLPDMDIGALARALGPGGHRVQTMRWGSSWFW